MMGLLRIRGFLLLWTGQLLVTLATWALRTVLLIWVYGLAHSGVAVSVVGLAEAAPLLVLAGVGGVFVDRWHRAGTMALATFGAAALLLPLLLVSTLKGFPIIITVAVLVNAALQLFMTAAGAAIPVVAGPERAGEANSLMSLLNGGVAVLAPGLGAILFGQLGPHATVLALAAILLVSVPILAVVPAPHARDSMHADSSVLSQMRAGLAYVRRSPLLMSLVMVASVAGLGFGALSVLDVVFVTRALHLPSNVVGLLLSASGLGELSGGLIMALVSTRLALPYHLLLGICAATMGAALIGYAIAPTLPIAIIALSVLGLMFPPVIVSFTTMVQRATEDAFMGRVNSIVNTGMGLMMLVSLASGGALTDLFGVRQVIAGCAVLLLAAGIVALVTIHRTPLPYPVNTGVAPADAEHRLLSS
jgi:DHA3 family macrolide efflux protein-like MFS transporter